MTDIARYEDARNARFEIERITIYAPSGRALALKHQVLTRNQIALRIALDHPVEPVRAGNGARVNQQRAGRHGFRSASFVVLNADPFTTVHALHRDDTGVEFHFDILRP